MLKQCRNERRGIDQGTIDRFVSGERSNIRIDTVDRLADELGLELRPKR